MKKKLLTLLIGVSVVLALIAVPLMTACAPEVPEVKTVKVGVILPLSGPAAMWGLPATTGIAIWLDEVNAAGGIEVGGERYLVEVIYYDDEYVGSKTLMGARKLVLEDEVVMITMQAGPPAGASAPFLTEQKMLTFVPDGFETGPDRPYYLAWNGHWPYMDGAVLQYIADTYPEIKKVAFAVQDDELGYYSIAMMKAVAEVNGWDLVYETLFSVDTVDFAPIMSAMLATDPDLLSFGGSWGDFRAGLVEQAYLQGYEGLIHASEWNLGIDDVVVGADYLEGFPAIFPSLNDPMLPTPAHEFYDKWMARFGPGGPEDVHRDFTVADWPWYDQMTIWALGAEQAGTFDSTAVRDAVLAMDTVPHMWGPAYWWGEDLYGVNHAALSPLYITEIRGGEVVAVMKYSLSDWVERSKEPLVKWFTEYGMMWWQQ